MARQLSSHTLSLLAVIAGVSAGLVTKARASDESLVQQRANAVVSLMSYAVVPDITASNLNIGSGTNDTSALTITQLGGGATLSEDVPLYLEGTLGYSRYDPQFVFTDGNETRTIPTKWNSLSATGGIGWDVGVHRDRFGGNLVLRPIANVTLGTVASDLRIGAALLEHRSDKNLDFLDGGTLNVYGLGGSLMLDYELFSAAQDIDAELRYSYQHLQSFTGTAESVSGQADAENLGLYLRRRAPCGTGPCWTGPFATCWRAPEPSTWESNEGCSVSTASTPWDLASNSTAASTTSSSPAPGWWPAICSATVPAATPSDWR